MINDDVVPFLDHKTPQFWRQRNGQFQHAWWTQEGAPPQRRPVTKCLPELFVNHVISLNYALDWLI